MLYYFRLFCVPANITKLSVSEPPSLCYNQTMAFPVRIKSDQLESVKVLYYEKGWSAREIAEHLDVGLRTVYNFMKRHGLERRDSRANNRLLFQKKPLSYKVLGKLSKEQKLLKVFGVLLYWTEGAKMGKSVDFANSDVEMCVIFIRFLREVCGVDESRLRGHLYCHENQDPNKLMDYWSQVLNLPRSQFTKPYVREYTDGRYAKFVKKRPERMEYGLIHVRYSDLKLLNQINEWIEGYKKNMGRYSSGQRGRAVNALAPPSGVRIPPGPPYQMSDFRCRIEK